LKKYIFFVCIFALAVILFPSAAFAKKDKQEKPFIQAFELQAGAEAPVAFGARASLRFPLGIETTLGIGYMPGWFVDGINKTMVSLDAYDLNTADLIRESLQNSLVIDFILGFDLFEPGGFFFDFGFSMITLGGSVSATSLIYQATGVDLSNYPNLLPVKNEIPVSTTLYSVSGHLGYQFYLTDSFSLSLAAGVIKAVGSYTEAEFKVPSVQTRELQQKLNDYMQETYKKYVVSPTLTIMFGYKI